MEVPTINGNNLEFGGFVIPLDQVVKYTDTTVIKREGDLYYVWRYSTKYHLTPQWHCEDISSHWLTIIYN